MMPMRISLEPKPTCGGCSTAGPPDSDQVSENRASSLDPSTDQDDRLAAGLLRLHSDRLLMVERETRLRERFAKAHPNVATAVVPALAGDVHDLDGLRHIGDLLEQTP